MSDEKQPNDEEKPRKSFWATMPRGSFGRVFLLLLLLGVVVYLQRRSGEIAGCAERAFLIPPPASNDSNSVQGTPSSGTIRARVVIPNKADR